MKYKTVILLLTFILSGFSFAKEALYKVYYGFLPVGEVVLKWNKDDIYVKGKVYDYLSFIYDYDFEFKWSDNDVFLYEKENGKKKVYRGKKLYEKKPWLPLLVKFLKTKKPDEKAKDFPYRLKIEGNKFIIFPIHSKKVSKIVVYFKDKEDIFPEKIKIYGKHYIKLVTSSPN